MIADVDPALAVHTHAVWQFELSVASAPAAESEEKGPVRPDNLHAVVALVAQDGSPRLWVEGESSWAAELSIAGACLSELAKKLALEIDRNTCTRFSQRSPNIDHGRVHVRNRQNK